MHGRSWKFIYDNAHKNVLLNNEMENPVSLETSSIASSSSTLRRNFIICKSEISPCPSFVRETNTGITWSKIAQFYRLEFLRSFYFVLDREKPNLREVQEVLLPNKQRRCLIVKIHTLRHSRIDLHCAMMSIVTSLLKYPRKKYTSELIKESTDK